MRRSRAWITWLAGMAVAGVATTADAGPTIVLDFKTAAAGNTTAITGDVVGAFDAAAFGFATTAAADQLIQSIVTELNHDYHDIPTTGMNGLSPIPDGKMLDIDFVTGVIGQPPPNGASEYYYVQIGTAVSGPNAGSGTLGVAILNAVRNAAGAADPYGYGVGAIVGSVFTNAIQALGGLTPSNALSSGNLAYSTQAIEGTLAHEIGHALSLAHEQVAGAVTPNGLPTLMGTGAIDLPNQYRIADREFSFSALSATGGSLHAVNQLVGALGLRDRDAPAVPEPASIAQAGIAAAIGIGAAVRRRRRRLAA